MTKKKSRKRSASSNDAQPEYPSLFIDRCAWSNRLGEALTIAAIGFIPHHQCFEHDCPDEVWLERAGKQGWIVVTRDQHIRRKPNELQVFRKNRVKAIVLVSGQASAADTARLLVDTYPKLMRKLQKAAPPAMFTVTLAGLISQIVL